MEKSKKIPGTDILVLEEFIASSDDDMEIHASVAAGFDTRKSLVVRLKYTDYDFRKNSYTQSAVIDFQRRNGLTQDGIIGKQTWTKLVLPAPSAYVLKTGSSGSAVRYAQKKLLSKLYPLGVDGIFGEQTDNAVKLFQTESGLTPDGIIGPLTWSVLTGLSSPRDR